MEWKRPTRYTKNYLVNKITLSPPNSKIIVVEKQSGLVGLDTYDVSIMESAVSIKIYQVGQLIWLPADRFIDVESAAHCHWTVNHGDGFCARVIYYLDLLVYRRSGPAASTINSKWWRNVCLMCERCLKHRCYFDPTLWQKLPFLPRQDPIDILLTWNVNCLIIR